MVSKIGFYTLTDERAKQEHYNLERCEMILTDACNFRCPYCRGVKSYSRDCGGHIDYGLAAYVLEDWANLGLKNIRFSGGEPTLHPDIVALTNLAARSIQRVAISTNGSMPWSLYEKLLGAGVNDWSVSLDACCAEDADKMAGRGGYFEKVVKNIRFLSARSYVTVGVVLTDETQVNVVEVVKFAHDLGVSDIRIITAAQYNGALSRLEEIPANILAAHPILRYRVKNLLGGRNVRGLRPGDTARCYLVRDDSVVAGKWHFPCVIHMREGGKPIGRIGSRMRQERDWWSLMHDTHQDSICVQNCLDCLVDYNNLCHKNKRR